VLSDIIAWSIPVVQEQTTAISSENPTQNRRKPQPDHLSADRSKGALFRKPHPIKLLASIAIKTLRASLPIFSTMFECLRELRSLFARIRFVCRHRPDLHGVDLGEFFEKTSDETYQVNRRSHGCSEDIERLLANRPWLTATDLTLAVEAWSRGAEWCARRHNQQ
jgi:hypothetical protein